LTTQKREDNRENDRVGQSRWETRLTRSEKSTRTWWNSQQETWAQRQKERRRDDQVGLRQDETHRLRDETVDEEEDESVEHSGHLGGLSASELETAPVGG
jgi:Asp-tRNA(Asn)/Glu-tRNA(Gln) amidotransferase B subunit